MFELVSYGNRRNVFLSKYEFCFRNFRIKMDSLVTKSAELQRSVERMSGDTMRRTLRLRVLLRQAATTYPIARCGQMLNSRLNGKSMEMIAKDRR